MSPVDRAQLALDDALRALCADLAVVLRCSWPRLTEGERRRVTAALREAVTVCVPDPSPGAPLRVIAGGRK